MIFLNLVKMNIVLIQNESEALGDLGILFGNINGQLCDKCM